MEEIIANVNWMAVIVGAVISYGIGWMWYSPKLFGNKWMRGVGLAGSGNGPSTYAMIEQAFGTFLLAWVVGLTATTDSLLTIVLITLTIMALVKANGLYSGKSKSAIMIEIGFIAVMVIVMILIHAIL